MRRNGPIDWSDDERQAPRFQNNRLFSDYIVVEEVASSNGTTTNCVTFLCYKNEETLFVTQFRHEILWKLDYRSPKELAERFLRVFSRELKNLRLSRFTTYSDYWIEIEEHSTSSNVMLNIYIEELNIGEPFKEVLHKTTSNSMKLAWLQQILLMCAKHYSNVYLAGRKERENGVEYTKGPGIIVYDGQCRLDHIHFVRVMISHTLEDTLWCEKELSMEEERQRYLKVLREEDIYLSAEDVVEMLQDHMNYYRNKRQTQTERNSEMRHNIWRLFLSNMFMEIFVGKSEAPWGSKWDIHMRLSKGCLEQIKQLLTLEQFCLLTRIFTAKSKSDFLTMAAEIYTKDVDQERRYTKLRNIGRGGYGEVHLAKHKTSNQFYAIKVLRLNGIKRSVEKLIEQLKDTMILSCCNGRQGDYFPIENEHSKKLVTYYTAFLSNKHGNWIENLREEDEDESIADSKGSLTLTGTSNIYKTAPETFTSYRETNYQYLFIVMEACSHSLSYEITKKGVCQSIRHIKELLETIQQLNENGYMHRDVKPANILITKRGRLVLSDLDTVQKVVDPSQETELPVRSILGTRGFMSPEMLKGNYNQKTDYYSLGISLLQVLFGNGDRTYMNGLKKDLCSPKPEEKLVINAQVIYLLRWLTDENPDNRAGGEHLPILKKLLTQQQRGNYRQVYEEAYWIILQHKSKPYKFQRMIRVSAEYETMQAAMNQYINMYSLEGDFNFETITTAADMNQDYDEHQLALLKIGSKMTVVPAKGRDCIYICNKEATISIVTNGPILTGRMKGFAKNSHLCFSLTTSPKLDVYELMDSFVKLMAAKKTTGALEVTQLNDVLLVQYINHIVDKLPDGLLNNKTMLWSPEMKEDDYWDGSHFGPSVPRIQRLSLVSPSPTVDNWRLESDIFSFGLLLFYLLTTINDNEKLQRTLRDLQSRVEVTHLEGLHIGLQQQILWMCHPNKKFRPTIENFELPQRGFGGGSAPYVLREFSIRSKPRIGTKILPHFCTIPGFRLFQEELLQHKWITSRIIKAMDEEYQEMLDVDEEDRILWVLKTTDSIKYIMYLDVVRFPEISKQNAEFGNEKLLISEEEYGKLVNLHIYVTRVLGTLKRSHERGFSHGNIKFTSLTHNEYWIGYPSFSISSSIEELEAATKKDICDVAFFLCNGLDYIFQPKLLTTGQVKPALNGIPERVRIIYGRLLSQMTAPDPLLRPSAQEILTDASIFSEIDSTEFDDVMAFLTFNAIRPNISGLQD